MHTSFFTKRLLIYLNKYGIYGIIRIPFSCKNFILNEITTIWWKIFLGNLGKGSKVYWGVWFHKPSSIFIGENCLINNYVSFSSENSDSFVQIGNNVHINRKVNIDYSGNITIKNNSLIFEETVIFTHSHGYNPHSKPNYSPLVIENDVWIGSRCLILSSVNLIQNNSIIGAGTLLTKDVTNNVIVAGNPSKVIKCIG